MLPILAHANPWSITSINEKEMGLLDVASYEKEKNTVSFNHRMLLASDGGVEVESGKGVIYQSRESHLVFDCKKNTFSVTKIKFLVGEKEVHSFPGVENIKAVKTNPIYAVACGKEIDKLKKNARIFEFDETNVAKLRGIIKEETANTKKK